MKENSKANSHNQKSHNLDQDLWINNEQNLERNLDREERENQNKK